LQKLVIKRKTISNNTIRFDSFEHTIIIDLFSSKLLGLPQKHFL